MKRVILAASLLCLSFAPAKAFLIDLEAGGYGAWWKPQDLDEGYGGGAVVRGQVIGVLGVDVRAGYFSFSDPSVDMIPIEAALMLRFPIPIVSLFAGLGAGYYQFSGEDGFELKNEQGWFGNAGVEISLSDWRVFLEWRYQLLDAEVDSAGGGFAAGDEIDFSGSGFTLGLTYRF
ncbi:MAG: outer membrane beta-barrel protein [Verrucomicrobiota bacterium]